MFWQKKRKTELGPEVPKRTKTDKNVTVEAEVVFKLLFFCSQQKLRSADLCK